MTFSQWIAFILSLFQILSVGVNLYMLGRSIHARRYKRWWWFMLVTTLATTVSIWTQAPLAASVLIQAVTLLTSGIAYGKYPFSHQRWADGGIICIWVLSLATLAALCW